MVYNLNIIKYLKTTLILIVFLFSTFGIGKAWAVLLGDVDNNGIVNAIDLGIVIDNYGKTPILNTKADIDNNGVVNIIDIGILIDNYYNTTSATPIPPPPPAPTKGIWISKDEIMSLPTSGSAWTRLLNAANGNWGTANLGDNNAMHDVYTLAGALVAVRTNSDAMRNKTIAGLQSAMTSPLSRALELSRGLQTYVIAADIIGYRTPEFESWVRKMLDANVSPHTGGSILCNKSGVSLSCSGMGGVLCTAFRSTNNWGGHARASAIASALYLNDQPLLNKLVNTHKAFIGIDAPNSLYCTSTNWHADSTNRYGMNKSGTTISGHDVSGILPEDWRRGSEYAWPPTLSGYMWEGMQGFVVSAVMLHRAGLVPFNAGDNSVVRAMDKLYKDINYPAESDDTWIPWVVNYYAGTNYPTQVANPGKNMGWTDWTLAR